MLPNNPERRAEMSAISLNRTDEVTSSSHPNRYTSMILSVVKTKNVKWLKNQV